jgi:xanthine dehydrogenase YagS FAD-binding subunit
LTYKLIDAREINKALQWLSKHWDRPLYPEYYDARTIDEAISLLNEFGEGSKIMASGIDIIGLIKNKVLYPGALINIKNIPDLAYTVETDNAVTLGALTTINDIEKSELIRSKYPALAEAAHSIASPQIRNMSTLGGNLCQDTRCWYYRRSPATGISFSCWRKKEKAPCYAVNGENQYHSVMGDTKCFAVCPSDMATILSALGATIRTINTRGGRTIPIGEFYTCKGTVLEPCEIITGVQVPHIKPETKQKYVKFRLRKTIDFAIVSVATLVTETNDLVTEARIVIGGVSSSPYRAIKAEDILTGEKLTDSVIEKAAEASVNGMKPLSKNDYKIPIVKALVKRAVLE